MIARLAPILLVLLAAAPLSAQDWNARPPNAAGQVPAFPQQTRAPALPDTIALRREVIAQGLNHPWALAQLPEGGWLVTERPGRLRHILPDGKVSKAIEGLPQVDARGQGGLLDIAVAPDFASSRRIYWTYAEPRGEGANATAAATGILSPDLASVSGVEVIFRQNPPWVSTAHFGSRIVPAPDGSLFVTTGERGQAASSPLAQDPRAQLGKVIRLAPTPEVFALGFRNIQAAAIGPDGALWTVEHGPKGGDELNRIRQGANYGWPVVSYGENYNGSRIAEGETARPGIEQPVYYWDPVIAPSGMAVVSGAMFPEWTDDLLIGGLQAGAVVRLRLQDGRVIGEDRIEPGIGRVRDVAIGADGAIWLVTDEDNGTLIRLTRR